MDTTLRLLPAFGDPGFDEPVDGWDTLAAPGGFEALMAVFGLVFVGVVVFGVIVTVRKYRILKDAGIDPLAADAEIAARVINSAALRQDRAEAAAPRPLEERLAELDDLLARGVITPDEHRDARAAALRG